mmetsp:Transcript_16931/g.51361  ORF Transcript_16931/g.51361 Transcript_16931/m.51361 type:complete len:294 (+) Transcript_16931:59-940(+)
MQNPLGMGHTHARTPRKRKKNKRKEVGPATRLLEKMHGGPVTSSSALRRKERTTKTTSSSEHFDFVVFVLDGGEEVLFADADVAVLGDEGVDALDLVGVGAPVEVDDELAVVGLVVVLFDPGGFAGAPVFRRVRCFGAVPQRVFPFFERRTARGAQLVLALFVDVQQKLGSAALDLDDVREIEGSDFRVFFRGRVLVIKFEAFQGKELRLPRPVRAPLLQQPPDRAGRRARAAQVLEQQVLLFLLFLSPLLLLLRVLLRVREKHLLLVQRVLPRHRLTARRVSLFCLETHHKV